MVRTCSFRGSVGSRCIRVENRWNDQGGAVHGFSTRSPVRRNPRAVHTESGYGPIVGKHSHKRPVPDAPHFSRSAKMIGANRPLFRRKAGCSSRLSLIAFKSTGCTFMAGALVQQARRSRRSGPGRMGARSALGADVPTTLARASVRVCPVAGYGGVLSVPLAPGELPTLCHLRRDRPLGCCTWQ